MTVTLASKTSTAGTVTATLSATITVYSASQAGTVGQIVEGWIDLRNMIAGDTIIVLEVFAIDGTTFETYNSQTIVGAQTAPVIRFPARILDENSAGTIGAIGYKVQLNATGGTARAVLYSFTTLAMSQ